MHNEMNWQTCQPFVLMSISTEVQGLCSPFASMKNVQGFTVAFLLKSHPIWINLGHLENISATKFFFCFTSNLGNSTDSNSVWMCKCHRLLRWSVVSSQHLFLYSESVITYLWGFLPWKIHSNNQPAPEIIWP